MKALSQLFIIKIHKEKGDLICCTSYETTLINFVTLIVNRSSYLVSDVYLIFVKLLYKGCSKSKINNFQAHEQKCVSKRDMKFLESVLVNSWGLDMNTMSITSLYNEREAFSEEKLFQNRWPIMKSIGFSFLANLNFKAALKLSLHFVQSIFVNAVKY